MLALLQLSSLASRCPNGTPYVVPLREPYTLFTPRTRFQCCPSHIHYPTAVPGKQLVIVTCNQVLQGLSCDIFRKSSVCVSVCASACGRCRCFCAGPYPWPTGAPSPLPAPGLRADAKLSRGATSHRQLYSGYVDPQK